MKQKALECADVIKDELQVHVISHIDADGLTSAAIMCIALERAGIDYSVDFVRQLTDDVLKKIVSLDPGLVIFTDLGSGMADKITGFGLRAVISDHHVPSGDHPHQLNPRLFGINGSYELSGSGTTFLIAMEMGNNVDLSGLAVVGAVGDLQHFKEGKLTGANRQIVKLGIKNGIVGCEKDLMLFGKQTRPIHKMIEYSSDPYIPSLSGDNGACIQLIKKAGVHMHGEKWLRWIDSNADEKQRITSALFTYAIGAGIPGHKVDRLIGTVYTLAKETEGTEMKDASEYSTLLNATARYDFANVGLAVCMGDRGLGYERAKVLLANHRKNLVDGINLVKKQGLIKLNNLQYFDAGSKIKETIVGIIAGMSYSVARDRSLPIVAFADSKDGIKVSTRGNYDLIHRGLDLAAALNVASSSVGGTGGGHDIAAGAHIPTGTKGEFIHLLDDIIGKQIR